MSSPFVRRSTALTAGAVVFAGLVAAPVAAFAAPPAGLAGIPATAVQISADPDGVGTLYKLTKDVSTYTTITLPNNATLNGAGHTITAVEDATHQTFLGPVVASAVGTDSAAARLDVKNLHITTQGFDAKDTNNGGKLSGIYMFRAGGSLTNVSVNGVSHDSGVQEGDGISIRNTVREGSRDDAVNVPQVRVELTNIAVTKYQKTGIRLDGNLSFRVENAKVGASAVQHNPAIAPNGITIMRGAAGSVRHSTFKLNQHVDSNAALLYNARNVVFDAVTVNGRAPATSGITAWNTSDTIHTTFTMRGGKVARVATPAGGTGLTVDGPAYAISATTIGTSFTGWDDATSGHVTVSPQVHSR